jgi:hypothetical protein
MNGIYDTKVFFLHEFDPIKFDIESFFAKLVIHMFGASHMP